MPFLQICSRENFGAQGDFLVCVLDNDRGGYYWAKWKNFPGNHDTSLPHFTLLLHPI
jgi:hypothetical protein